MTQLLDLATLPERNPPLINPRKELKTRSKTSFKTIFKSSSKVVPILLSCFRDMSDITGYTAGDLYAHNDDGTIIKMFIPIPWWDPNRGNYRIMEISIISVRDLTHDTKIMKLEESKLLQFYAPDRVHYINRFFVYNSKFRMSGRKETRGIYTRLIKNDRQANLLLYTWTKAALESAVKSAEKAPFLRPSAVEIKKALESIINELNRLLKEETIYIENLPGETTEITEDEFNQAMKNQGKIAGVKET